MALNSVLGASHDAVVGAAGAGAAGAGAVAGEHLRKAQPLSSIRSPSGELRTADRGGRCADAPTRAGGVWLFLLSYPAASGDGSAEVFAGGDAEFCEHVAQVPLDDTGVDVQLGGDLLVGVPVPGKLGDLGRRGGGPGTGDMCPRLADPRTGLTCRT